MQGVQSDFRQLYPSPPRRDHDDSGPAPRADEPSDSYRSEKTTGNWRAGVMAGLALLSTAACAPQPSHSPPVVKVSSQNRSTESAQNTVNLRKTPSAETASQSESEESNKQASISDLNIDVHDNIWGNFDIRGKTNDSRVSLDVDQGLLGGYNLHGDWDGETVDLDLGRALLGGYNLHGKVGGKKVDLEINHDLWGDHNVSGSWAGEKVKLSVDRSFHGLKVEGQWGSSNVNYTAHRGLLGKFRVRGEGPDEAFFPWIVSERLHTES